MKVSKREKLLLTLLLLLGAAYLFYSFLLIPQRQLLNATQLLLEDKKRAMTYSKLEADPQNRIYEEYKALNARILNSTKGLFPSIRQEKIILILQDMIDTSHLKVSSINFSVPAFEVPEEKKEEQGGDYDPAIKSILDEIVGRKAPAEGGIQATEPQEQAYRLMHMNGVLTFEGSYFDILSFMNRIENYDKKILINSLNMAATDKGSLTGSITLDFYALPKLHDQDQEYLRWDLLDVYGKENPFGKGAAKSGASASVAEAGASKSDFTLIVSPMMSDLPSVVIGKTLDNRGDTQIYADNPAKEPVELQVYMAQGKYYYKYKTAGESYPKDYENKGVQFEPAGGQIKLQVASVPRSDAQDKNGVLMSIINKTDLDLVVDIDNDDGAAARFELVNSLGKVVVNR
jgi:type IV pilus assembly protein PilO